MSFPTNDDHDRTCSHKMAFVHRQSCEGVKSELDLFAVPPTQTSIDDCRWVEHQPLTSLDSGGPIEFMLPGTGDAYLDLANTYLLIRAKVVRGDGTDLAADTQVAPVNNWLHSLFSQVDVYINDTLVTPSSNTYPIVHTSKPYLVMVPKRRRLNSPANCGIKTPPDIWMQRWTMVAMQVWLSDESTLRRVVSSR